MNRSGIEDSSIALAANVFMILAGIGTQSCLAWTLGPEGRGSLAVCLIFAFLLAVICSFGLDSALQYYVASKKMTVAECVSTALSIACVGGIFAAFLGYVLMSLELPFFQKADKVSFFISLGYVPINMLEAFMPRFFVGLRDFKWMAIYQICQASLKLLFVLILVWVFSLGVNGGLFASILTGFILIFLALLRMRKVYGTLLIRPSVKHWTMTFQYGIRFYFGKLGNITTFQVGTLILAFFVSKKEIGYFVVASRIMGYVFTIPNAMQKALLPRVAEHPEGKGKMVSQAMRISGLLCTFLVIVILGSARPLIPFVFSQKFVPMVPLMWLLAPGIVVRSVSKLIVPYLNGINRPGLSSIAILSGVCVNLISLFVLLPLMGLRGGALAVTLGYLASSLVLFTSFKKLTGIPYRTMLRYSQQDLSYLKDRSAKLRFAVSKSIQIRNS